MQLDTEGLTEVEVYLAGGDLVEDNDEWAQCPACGEHNLPSGQLGRKIHYCCTACGNWYYEDAITAH